MIPFCQDAQSALIRSVTSPEMGYGQLNDMQISEVEPRVKFYATKWWGHPLGDDKGEPSVFW